jgi:hypothetical protein
MPVVHAAASARPRLQHAHDTSDWSHRGKYTPSGDVFGLDFGLGSSFSAIVARGRLLSIRRFNACAIRVRSAQTAKFMDRATAQGNANLNVLGAILGHDLHLSHGDHAFTSRRRSSGNPMQARCMAATPDAPDNAASGGAFAVAFAIENTFGSTAVRIRLPRTRLPRNLVTHFRRSCSLSTRLRVQQCTNGLHTLRLGRCAGCTLKRRHLPRLYVRAVLRLIA